MIMMIVEYLNNIVYEEFCGCSLKEWKNYINYFDKYDTISSHQYFQRGLE